MRSWVGCSWVFAVALGVFGCGSSESDASGGNTNKGGEGGGGWLPGGSEPPFPVENAEPSDGQGGKGTGGNLGAGGGAQASGGGGGMALPADPIDVLCPNYKDSESHSISAAMPDPGSYASATRTRELLKLQQTPVPSSVRAAELVNYFGWRPPPVDLTDKFQGSMEVRMRTLGGVQIPTQLELYVGVVAGTVVRPPVVLTLVADSSLTPSAKERAQASVEAILAGLKPGDTVTLIQDPSSKPTPVVIGQGDPSVLASEVGKATGSIAARLPAAYQQAETAPAGSWNHVVVIGDGEEDADAPNYGAIEAKAANAKIRLTALGVSPETSYGDAMLYRLSHAGRGRYLYIDDKGEPSALFAKRFDEVFGIFRDKVRVLVELPAYMHSTDPNPPAGGAVAQDKYVAPGEWAEFVFHLSVCHKDLMVTSPTGDVPIKVQVTSTMPDGVAAADFSMNAIPKKVIFAGKYPNLDRMAAIQSFAEVLKYPEATRFNTAKSQLAALAASPGPELSELLALHPEYPKP